MLGKCAEQRQRLEDGRSSVHAKGLVNLGLIKITHSIPIGEKDGVQLGCFGLLCELDVLFEVHHSISPRGWMAPSGEVKPSISEQGEQIHHNSVLSHNCQRAWVSSGMPAVCIRIVDAAHEDRKSVV